MKETVDPRLIKALFLDVQPAFPLGDDATLDEIYAKFAVTEAEHNRIGALSLASKPFADNVCTEELKITGVDNNEIQLVISHPPRSTPASQTPCILYLHGGGMATYSVRGAMYSHFAADIAAVTEATVVAVEFRNSAGALGCHPFPAGLNDCKDALEWLYSQKESRHISQIILVGESGGANLCCALSLLMKREGKLHYIDGVHAMCPYISNLYSEVESEESRNLPSLRRFDRCGIVDLKGLHAKARCYDPLDAHSRNPLAWPNWATIEDLQGMSPHAVSVNEADPLRDEGTAYYRKLLSAGVRATGRVVLGTPHAADLIGMQATVDMYKSLLYDIKSFVDSL